MSVLQKKVCLLGEFAVGKTSLIRRYVEGRFDDKYLSTIGVKISRKPLTRAQHMLNLIIWDLAGSDDFDGTHTNYLRGAAGALIVCDLTRRETLSGFQRYAEQVYAINPKAALVLVGNKLDLAAERTVSDEDMQAVSTALACSYCLTSAKSGEQVEAAFENLAERLEQLA
jgi:small GTP-binding protein